MGKAYTIIMILKHYNNLTIIAYPYDIRHKLYDINILDNRDRVRDYTENVSRVTLVSRSLSKITTSQAYTKYNIYTDLMDLSKLLLHQYPRTNIFIYRLIKFFTLLIHLPTYKYDS